jgi:hypothetical protein
MTTCAPFMIALTCEPIATKVIKQGSRRSAVPAKAKGVSSRVFDMRGRIIGGFSGMGLCHAESTVPSGLYFTEVGSGEGNSIRMILMTQ